MAQSTKTRTKSTGKSTAGRSASSRSAAAKSGNGRSSYGSAAAKSSGRKSSSGAAKSRKSGAAAKSVSGRRSASKVTADRRAEARKKAVRNSEVREREVKEDITLVVLIIIISFLFLSLLGFGGSVGKVLADMMFGFFGIGSWGFPFYLFFFCYFMITGRGGSKMPVRMFAVLLLLLIVETGGHLYLHHTGKYVLDLPFNVKSAFRFCAEQHIGGGVIGGALASLLYYAFRMVGSFLILAGLGIIAVILLLQASPIKVFSRWKRERQEDGRPGLLQRHAMYRQRRLEKLEREKEERLERETDRILRQEDLEVKRRSSQAYDGDISKKKKQGRVADGSFNLEHTQLDRRDGSPSIPGRGGKRGSNGKRSLPGSKSTKDVHEIVILPEERRDAMTVPGSTHSSPPRKGRRQTPDPEGTRFINSGNGDQISDSLHYDRMNVTFEDSADHHAGFQEVSPLLVKGSADKAGRTDSAVNRRGGNLYPASDLGYGSAPVYEDAGAGSTGNPSDYAGMYAGSEYLAGASEPDPRTEVSGAGPSSRERGTQRSPENPRKQPVRKPGSGRLTTFSETSPDDSDEKKTSVYTRKTAANTMSDDVSGLGSDTASGAFSGAHSDTASGAFSGARSDTASGAFSDTDSADNLQDIAIHRDTRRGKSLLPGPGRIARPRSSSYVHPPFSLLVPGSDGRSAETEKELRETAGKLQDTLRTFGVQVTITDISQGPSVTRYELKPDKGVKVSKIVNLSDDIKLRLAATDIRIEAPIPGKSAIGIEVPNRHETTVHLRELLETREFKHFKGKLPFAVGKDIGGKTIISDITRMPHLLIAGATGSGKSVCINTIILSILYSMSPDDVKLLMIDPKVVELSVYKKIPHLIIPVVTDARKASAALNWAVAEMEKRYKMFAAAGVRDLAGFNSLASSYRDEDGEPQYEPFPRLVIIVDELADLMMVAKSDVESAICRLAQLARAAGIHLIIATQRPSVDVITGLIKANMPSRIAFAVSSQVDSRTILDMAGAEKLIGRGDMLFSPQNYQKPARIQGAFVSDDEVSKVVEYITSRNSPKIHDEEISRQIEDIQENGVTGTGPEDMKSSNSGRDEHFAEAGRFIIEKNKASIGLLQRVFKIGFNRAARIMDQLAEAGVVSEESSTRARQVLMTIPEFEKFLEEEG